MLESLNQKQKVIFFIILSLMIIFIIYYIYQIIYNNDNYGDLDSESFYIENSINTISISNNLDNSIDDNLIIVYICGAVKESKVISLKENSRISDAIESAGGLTDDADLTNINLAYILEDGEKIYIPTKGENIEESNYTSNNSSKESQKININKATQTELETIPGIGPSLALKIINYRETNGKFSSIEDIKNVSGIGNSKYENIKNYISTK